ncbi:MAG: flagellar export protein FliJ [Succinivibrio sp.]|nr:flagellar export protein FliJ [Succinivibrio sp.]
MADDRALHLVLDQRKKEEDEAREQFVQAHQAVLSYEQQLQQLRQFHAMYLNELQQKTQGGMDMNIFTSYQNFLVKLKSIEKRQELGLYKLQDQEKRMQQEYLKRQQRRKVIESLLERHRQEALALEARAEQKLTDDIVSSKAARALIEQAHELEDEDDL